MIFVRGRAAHDGPGAVGEPGLLLFRREDEFRVHVEEILRYHRIFHKEVLWLLVIAAEPRLMGDERHPGNAFHPLFVAHRQQLDERDLVSHDEPVRAGDFNLPEQGLLDRAQKGKQNEGHENRKQSQRGAQFLALQIAPDQVQVFHFFYMLAGRDIPARPATVCR